MVFERSCLRMERHHNEIGTWCRQKCPVCGEIGLCEFNHSDAFVPVNACYGTGGKCNTGSKWSCGRHVYGNLNYKKFLRKEYSFQKH